MTAATAASPELCPTCQVNLVTLFDEPSWCERCEYGLDRFIPPIGLGPIGRVVERLGMRLGFRLNRRLFADISAKDIRRPGVTPAFLVLLVVSLLLFALALGAAVGGILLIIKGNVMLAVLGALLLGTAVLLRPRLGRLKPLRECYDELTRQEAPELFALIEKSAHAVGTHMVDVVLVGPEWNAFAGRFGLRRKRVLMLGVPMWVALRPQERVALLGHELGHFVNHDVRRGLLTQPACTVFAELARLFRPDSSAMQGNWITMIAQLVVTPVQLLLAYTMLIIHIGLILIASRDSQRSEYYADALAMELAGTDGLVLRPERRGHDHRDREPSPSGRRLCGLARRRRTGAARACASADAAAPADASARGLAVQHPSADRNAARNGCHATASRAAHRPDRGSGGADRRRARAVRGELPAHDRALLVICHRSRSCLRRARSFSFARRMAPAITAPAIFAKPLGSPRFRSVIRVWFSPTGSHV